jgi:hypothetical protein
VASAAARLPEQPIFYPVLNQEYAAMIARNWNVKHSGSGYVTRLASAGRSRTATRSTRSATATIASEQSV